MVDHPTRSRLAEIFVDRHGQPRTRGSGYVVASGWVLTAAHVIAGADRIGVWCGTPPDLEPAAGIAVDPAAVLDCRDADLALLQVGREGTGDVEPVLWGRLDPAQQAPEPVVAAGCPLHKLRESQASGGELVREVRYATGSVHPGDNPKTGTYAFELSGQGPRDVTDPGEDDPWEGMSGAAAWAGNRLIGVVGQHHPAEGTAALTVCPVAGLYEHVHGAQLRKWQDAAELPASGEGLWLPRTLSPRNLGLRRAQRAAAELAPVALIARQFELDELAAFSTGDASGARFSWIRADAFAGKTALLAWFALHPPATVDVVTCFLRRTRAATSAEYAVDFLARQLAALADRMDFTPAPHLSQLIDDMHDLLDDAARACRQRHRQLLLVIDGLDEYDHAAGVPIDSWLPDADTLPDDVRLLCSSRAHVDIRLPPDHPLLRTEHPLPMSEAATHLQRRCALELGQATSTGDDAVLPLLGCLASAGGGLAPADLAELLRRRGRDLDVAQVEAKMTTSFGRTAPLRPDIDRLDAASWSYQFAHSELLAAAEQIVSADRVTYRGLIDDWARAWTDRGWPPDTPTYLLARYPATLVGDRRARLAQDAGWVDRSVAAMGVDPTLAFLRQEAEAAVRSAAASGQPDAVLDVVRCVLTAATLNSLTAGIPVAALDQLVAVRAWTLERALAAAERCPTVEQRVQGMLTLSRRATADTRYGLLLEALHVVATTENKRQTAALLPTVGVEQPGPLTEAALQLARDRLDGEALVEVLVALAPAAADGGDSVMREAYALALTLPEREGLTSRPTRAWALTTLLDHAREPLASTIAAAAVDAALRVDSTDVRAKVLARIAADLDPPRRAPLVEKAFRDAQIEQWEQGPAQAMEALAPVLPESLLATALEVAAGLSWPLGRVDVLVALAPVLPPSLLPDALAAVNEIEEPGWRGQAAAALAARLAETGDVGVALALLASMPDRWQGAGRVAIVRTLAEKDGPAALAVAGEVTVPWQRLEACCALLAGTDAVAEEAAEQLRQLASNRELREMLRGGEMRNVHELLTDTALHLARSHRFDTALEVLEMLPTRDTHGGSPRGAAYAAIAAAFPEERRTEILNLSLASCSTISDTAEQARALCALAADVPQRLAGPIRAEAVHLARQGLTPEHRADTLSELLPLLDGQLADDVTRDLLASLPELADHDRNRIWTRVSPRLTPVAASSLLDQASARTEPDDDSTRAWLLARAARLASDTQVPAVHAAADRLQDVEQRTTVLADIIPRLTAVDREHTVTQLLADAARLPATTPTGYSPRAEALTGIAPILEAGTVSEAVALADSLEHSAPDGYLDAWTALAPRLAELGLAAEALAAISKLPYSPADALARVIPHLPDDLVNDAEQIADTIDPVWRRAVSIALARRARPGQESPWLWEAVYAAATPDVWAGAGDLTTALDDLAAAITPAVIAAVLDHTDRHPYAAVRAQARVNLAPFLPRADRAAAYAGALAAVETESDESDRGELLAKVGPRLPDSLVTRAADLAAAIATSKYVWSSPRADALAALAPRLAALGTTDRAALLVRVVHTSVSRPRKELLLDLAALAPAFRTHGGDALVMGFAEAVLDVTRRWP